MVDKCYNRVGDHEFYTVMEEDYAKLEAELERHKKMVDYHNIVGMEYENQKLRDLLLSVNHDNCDHLDDAIMMIQQALEVSDG